MKKTIISGLLIMATSGVAFAAGTPGQSIGTGNMTVNGTVGASSCTVLFPSSVSLPTIDASLYNAAKSQTTIISEKTPGITFNDCSGSTVKVRIDATSPRGTSGNNLRVALPGDGGNTFIALQLANSNDKGYKINADDPSLTNIEVKNDSYNIPLNVKALRWSTDSLPSAVAGQYSAVYTFTATYM
ncbi:type 1 fimbrial protein [Escherichia coli]|nr:type 1 fimbrial protein [Escherichia coli]